MRKKTQYIVVNEIYKTIYCGYPQKRAWKIITGSSGGMYMMRLSSNASHTLRRVETVIELGLWIILPIVLSVMWLPFSWQSLASALLLNLRSCFTFVI